MEYYRRFLSFLSKMSCKNANEFQKYPDSINDELNKSIHKESLHNDIEEQEIREHGGLLTSVTESNSGIFRNTNNDTNEHGDSFHGLIIQDKIFPSVYDEESIDEEYEITVTSKNNNDTFDSCDDFDEFAEFDVANRDF